MGSVMAKTRVAIQRKRPTPLTDTQIAVLRIQIAALEAALRKHNADLAAHTRAIEAAVEPIRKALEAMTGKIELARRPGLAPAKRRSRK